MTNPSLQTKKERKKNARAYTQHSVAKRNTHLAVYLAQCLFLCGKCLQLDTGNLPTYTFYVHGTYNIHAFTSMRRKCTYCESVLKLISVRLNLFVFGSCYRSDWLKLAWTRWSLRKVRKADALRIYRLRRRVCGSRATLER